MYSEFLSYYLKLEHNRVLAVSGGLESDCSPAFDSGSEGGSDWSHESTAHQLQLQCVARVCH